MLDEATSALDSETEAAFIDAITKLAGSVTMVVIVHRISTLKARDQVLAIDNGRVVTGRN